MAKTRESANDGLGAVVNVKELVKHLVRIKARMYGAYWCGDCEYQESLFGDGDSEKGKQLLIDNGIYVECCLPGQRESDGAHKDIVYYPTWEFYDKKAKVLRRYKKVFELEELAKKVSEVDAGKPK